MKRSSLSVSLLGALLILTAGAQATPLGTNITISDRNFKSTNPNLASSWYSNREDNETETNPDTVNAQEWDLEAMFLRGSTLTLVGGFDFKNGTNYGGHTYTTGDIFIDTGANSAIYGQAANGGSGTTAWTNIQPFLAPNSFGYDYAVDIRTFGGAAGSTANTTFSYNMVQLSPTSVVTRVLDVAASNPWTYNSGGTVVASGTGQYGLLTANEIAAYGLKGDALNTVRSNRHFFLTLDLATIPGSAIWNENIFHYTVECGNDDLMARGRVPEASGTLALVLAGLAGLVAFRRRAGR